MTTKKRTRKTVPPNPVPTAMSSESVSQTLRKIDNGVILERSHSKPDGSYHHSEVYHPTKPNIAVPAVPKPARKPAAFGLKKKRTRSK